MITDRLALYGAGGAFVATALVAGWLAFGKHEVGRQRDVAITERDVTTTFADNACTAIGQRYTPVDKGPPPRASWGAACLADIRELFRREQVRAGETLGVVTTHAAEQTTKRAADAKAARRDEARLSEAEQKLKQEAAHAAATDGLYGPGYFDGINSALRLRPYQGIGDGPAAADAGGDRAEGGAGR